MEGTYDFGMIGIGVMGSNLLLNIADNRFAVIGFDLKQERADKLEAAAPKGTIVKGTTDIGVMAKALKKPRKIMMLVPAGKPVDDVINNLLPHLENGDIVIDGGYGGNQPSTVVDCTSGTFEVLRQGKGDISQFL